MEVILYTTTPKSLFVGRKYPEATAFHFLITQFYEEVIEEEHYFWGSLDIWVVDRPELSRHIDIFDHKPGVMYTIPPEQTKIYTVYWDQIFDNEMKLWYFYNIYPPAPIIINLKARAELQVYQRFNVFKSMEIEFSIVIPKFIFTPKQNGILPDKFILYENKLIKDK